MIVKDLYDEIVESTLSNTIWSSPDEKKKKEVFHLINAALKEIYSKFLIKERCVVVELQESRTTYPLTEEHLVQPPLNIVDYDHYLYDEDYLHANQDFFEPFREKSPDTPHLDLIKIMSVSNQYGDEIPLNNGTAPYSVCTPAYNVIQVPSSEEEEVLYVYYQAGHPKVTQESDRLELPEHLTRLVVLYVATRILIRIGTQDALTQSQHLNQQYQMFLNDIVMTDSLSQSYSQTNTKFNRNGWI